MGIKIGSGVKIGGGPKIGGGTSNIGRKPVVLGQDDADPLKDVEYTGDLAVDAASELTALEQAYRNRAKAEAKRFTNATDSEFWFAVCFPDREAKEAFLSEFGAATLGDKYLDGAALARILRKQLDKE